MVRAALVLVSLIFFCVTARAGGLADADAGIARLNAGDPATAIALFTRAIQSKELSEEVVALTYYHRGMAFHKQGQAGRAILDYSTALWNGELPRDFRPRTLNNRGYAFEAISDHESAMRDYSLAIKLNPNYAEAFANRGNVQRHFGRHDMALLDYDAALRNGHPRAAFVFTWQGMALEAQGRRREAMDAFRRALSIDPNLALAKSNLARLEVGQQMSSVLGRKKVAKGPITPLVLTATPGSAPVAANENIQLTQWTPPTAPEPPAMKDPVVSPAVAPAPAPAPTASARNAVSLRPAFDDHPPALPAVAAAPAPAPVKPTAPVVTAIRPVANGEGGSDIAFAIQLGSFKSPELAEAGWAKALKVAGDLLNGLSHAVETVTVTEGTVYRLFAEALPDRKAALGLCRTLRDKGTPCIVVRR